MSATTTTTTTTQLQTIAFLGATGGCTLPVLARALKAGHRATALVRNPTKLRTLLLDTNTGGTGGVPADLIDRNLAIIAGDASNATAVRALLCASDADKTLVDTVISGIGSLPKMQWSLRRPVVLQQPGLCEDAARGVHDALRQLLAEGYRAPGPRHGRAAASKEQGGADRKPVMVAISSTGISRLQRDVPLPFVPFYHWFLAAPHEDKRAMEDRVVAACRDGALRGFVIVRPSLLLDGEPKGPGALRVGWEEAEKAAAAAPGPAIGYTLTREEVAAWIWEQAVGEQEEWVGKCVSLTY